MTRDQIEGSNPPTEDNIFAFLDTPGLPTGKQLADLNSAVSPAVLAGLLGCNVAMIYQYRQDGKLPPNSDASLRDCIKHHVLYYKTKAASKANNMSEAALVQKIQLDRAKTEQAWLAIKKERGELVDTKILAEVFEPYFINVRMQLCSLARKFPEMQQEVDKMISGWKELGKKVMMKSQQELDDFIQIQMEKEVELEKEEPDDL